MFEQTLINTGVGSYGLLDGQVLTSDINTITQLSLGNGVSSLQGIEGFVALQIFAVSR